MMAKTGAALNPVGLVRQGREENCFDALRLFAALAVAVTHSYEHLGLSVLWLKPGTRLWFFDGVPLFFILSGLLVYRSCEKCQERGLPILSFYVNRFLRVAPAIYGYVLITPCVLLALGALVPGDLLRRDFAAWLASNLVLLPIYYPDVFRHIGIGVLNGSLWTIPVECSFYAVVPVICLTARRRGPAVTAGILAGLSLVGPGMIWLWELLGLDSMPMKLLKVTCLPYLVFFALGIGWSWGWKRVGRHWSLCAVCLLVYVSLRYELLAPRAWLGPFWTIAWGIPLSYVVLWVGYGSPAFLRALNRIGDLSYGVYVWHMVVVNLLLYVAARTWGCGDAVVLALAIGTTLMLARCSWWLLERPCLRLKPFTSREPVRTAAAAVLKVPALVRMEYLVVVPAHASEGVGSD